MTHDLCILLQPPNLELCEAMLENIGQGVEPSRTASSLIREQQQKLMHLESSSCSGCSRGAVAEADRIGE